VRKIFKVKDCVSIEKAANHLSQALEDKIEASDIFELVLNKHLKLSVQINNPQISRPAVSISKDLAEFVTYQNHDKTLLLFQYFLTILQSDKSKTDDPTTQSHIKDIEYLIECVEEDINQYTEENIGEVSSSSWLLLPAIFDEVPKKSFLFRWLLSKYTLLNGYELSKDEQLIISGEEMPVEGLFDLSLVGNGEIEVKKMYQNAINGSKYNAFDPNGVFLESIKLGDNVPTSDSSKDFIAYIVLHQYFPEEVKLVDINTISEDSGDRVSNDEYALFFQLLKERDIVELEKYNLDLDTRTPGKYRLPDRLPKDINLVIRTSELSRFISSLMDDPEFLEKPATKQKETRTPEPSLIDSLGILAYMLSESTPKFKWGENPNAKEIAEAIEQKAHSLGVEVKELTNLSKDISMAVKKVAPRINK
jgi:hypothetical protein